MPKIFLIKDRLMQQQQRLSLTKDEDRQAEAKSREILIGGGEHSKPLSLVKKGQEKAESDDERHQSLVETGKEPPDRGPPRRFVSALGGGNVPYGSHGHVLTCAQRKEYSLPPQIQATLLLKSPDERVKLPETPQPKPDDKPKAKNLLAAAPVRNFSVIKRAPTSKQDEDKDTRLPPLVPPQQEPEQDQPIDYHIPKRKGETEDENEERKLREQRRSQCNKICKPVLLPGGRRVGKMPVMMSAAAGHGRGSANAGGQGGSSQPSSTSGGGGTINFSTGGSSGGVGGSMGGGTGGGGPGRDGRQNYGPSSPPSGSLPPFYESLKSGNNGNTFNANSFASNYLSMNNMDCEAGHQELANLNLGGVGGSGGGGGNASPPRSYSTLQNANYGIIMKDENSLDFYESKGGEGGMSLLTGNGSYCYDEAMMRRQFQVEIDGNLQFNTAGLNFTASGNDLLESLTNSTDLSSFLTKIPDGAVDNELNSDNNGQIGQQVDSDLEFNDQIILNSRSFDSRNGYGGKFSNLYGEALPSYTPPNEALQQMYPPRPQPYHSQQWHNLWRVRNQTAAAVFNINNGDDGSNNNDTNKNNLHHHVNISHQQVQLNQQPNQMLSPSLSFSGSVGTLDLDSPTTMSLPSPSGTTMCSSDNNDRGSLSPPTTTGTGNVSGRRSSTSSGEAVAAPVLKTRAANNVLHGRLGLSADYQLEFVNGGAGVKNPMASQEPTRHGPRTEDKTKVASITTEDGQTNFCCRQCNKTFALQRLLNRHMKCHSDVKRYLCTFCGKGFNDTFDLKRHTRTHTGVRPYKCQLCEKSFTQRCSLESHCLKVHGVQHQYAYKERRTKMYVCEECGHTTSEPEVHYIHLKEKHPYSPALLKFYDKRHFKFTNSNFANMLLQDEPQTVDSQTMPGLQ